MESSEKIELFDLKRLLIGEDLPYSFLLEVFFRTGIMFSMVLLILRLSGKRGIKQLSIFELAIIISLGSAAGDPMFYEDVALLPAILVFSTVIGLYKLLTYLTGKVEKIEIFLEGKPIKLIDSGKINFEIFDHEALAYDELFTQLRQRHVTHLGQVKTAYMETSGDISVFFYLDEDVRFGLPILPELYDNPCKILETDKIYACRSCGELNPPFHADSCPICHNKMWIEANNELRIT